MEVLIARGESVHQLHNKEEFPSGQREQTVNLSSPTSVVRIHPLPPAKGTGFYLFLLLCGHKVVAEAIPFD